MVANAPDADWASLRIICPSCGNDGGEEAGWFMTGKAPFRLVEDVIRSWIFDAKRDENGTLVLTADASNDEVDWESGTNLRLECGQCFGTFPLLKSARVEFE